MNLCMTYALVSEVFKNKIDKSGRPYFEHFLYVASKMDTDEEKIIALLHDVPEDTKNTANPITIQNLREMGYSEEIVRNVDVLTHKSEEDYESVYIRRITKYPKAKKVKLADLEHNSQVTRLKGLRQKDFIRLEKYLRSYVYLKN